MNTRRDLLLIEGIYDLLSRRHDGVITPCAPLLVQVSDTLPGEGERVEFFLCPEGGGEPIPVRDVFIHTPQKVIVMLPYLPPGNYRPVMTVHKQGEASRMVGPDNTVWRVEEEVKVR